jgi:hypothetical protein
MTIIGIYYADPFININTNISKINFVNISLNRKSQDFTACGTSELYSQEGVSSGILYTNYFQNEPQSYTERYPSFINSFETLYLLDGNVSFNVPRKYVENDPSIFDPIVVKPTSVSGAYLKYINNLEVVIEGIISEKLKRPIFKYTLRAV